MAKTSEDKYQYWAALPAEELAPKIIEKAEDYYKAIKSNGILSLWRRVYTAYYGLDSGGMDHAASQILFAGDQDELLQVRVKHLKSLVQYLWITTTATRMNYQPRAINTDYKTRKQVYIAKSVIDYYEREKHYDRTLKSTALRALLYGVGYYWQYWDYFAGSVERPDVDPETGKETGALVREGDIRARALSPIDVITDLSRPPDEQQWYIVRGRANRYDVISRFPDKPELQEEILGIEDPEYETCPTLFRKGFGSADEPEKGVDDLYVWHFYHKPTEAMPQGRYLVVYSSNVWGVDTALPEGDLPVQRMYPEEFLETAWGYTSAWDLVTCNELYDGLVSALFSYIDAALIPNILAPIGTELGAEDIGGGLNLLKYPPETQPPAALSLFDTNVARSAVEIANWIQADMQKIPGISGLARGQVDSNIKSGSMAALVHAQTLHFNSALEASYVQLAEDVATALVRLCKSHVATPKIISIVGEDDKGKLGEFTGEDLAQIDRVVVDVGNPLERSIAGKEQMASTLLERGLLQNPEYYFEVLRTGRLESVFRPQQAQVDAIKSENELLSSGNATIIEMDSQTDANGTTQRREVVKECPVLATDDHRLHVQRHAAEINQPEARTNTDYVTVVLAHIRDHLFQVQFGDPMIAQVMGYGPPPGMAEPVPPGGDGGAEPPESMPALERPPNIAGGAEGQMPVNMPKPAQPPIVG